MLCHENTVFTTFNCWSSTTREQKTYWGTITFEVHKYKVESFVYAANRLGHMLGSLMKKLGLF